MLFEHALSSMLCLDHPWHLDRYVFQREGKRLDVYISINREAALHCPECDSSPLPIHRSEPEVLRFFNFFHYQTFIHTTRVWCLCPVHGEQRIEAPWETLVNNHLIQHRQG